MLFTYIPYASLIYLHISYIPMYMYIYLCCIFTCMPFIYLHICYVLTYQMPLLYTYIYGTYMYVYLCCILYMHATCIPTYILCTDIPSTSRIYLHSSTYPSAVNIHGCLLYFIYLHISCILTSHKPLFFTFIYRIYLPTHMYKYFCCTSTYRHAAAVFLFKCK